MRYTTEHMERDALERMATEKICACWYYELQNSLEETDDETLQKIINDSQYCHKQNQAQNPVSRDELREELMECPDFKGIEQITMTNDGDHWVCVCGNNTMASGFYPTNSKNDFVEPTAEHWDTNDYGCPDCGRIINQATGEIVDYTDAKKLQGQL